MVLLQCFFFVLNGEEGSFDRFTLKFLTLSVRSGNTGPRHGVM